MKKGVLGVSLTSFDMGDIEITTVGQPDGGIGTYKPQFMNLGVGYSKLFTKTISGGVVFRIVSEGISDVKALGVAFDAGVQITSPKVKINTATGLEEPFIEGNLSLIDTSQSVD